MGKQMHPQMFTVALWMWVCIAQVPMSLIMVFLLSLLQGSTSGAVCANLLDGMACYVAGLTPASEPAAVCSKAQTFYLWSLLPGFAFNFAMPVSTRYGGAGLLWFVRAMAVPGAAILFSWTWAMGSYATALSPLQVLGLFFVVGGVVVFNWRYPQNR